MKWIIAQVVNAIVWLIRPTKWPVVLILIGSCCATATAQVVRVVSDSGQGSGAIVCNYADGCLVLTANHVVERGRISLTTNDDTGRTPARLVQSWPDSDTAIIHVPGLRAKIERRIRRDRVQVGDRMRLQGWPYGRPWTGAGSVNATAGKQPKYWVAESVHSGASGGPVIDESTGEISGVISGYDKHRPTEAAIGRVDHVAEWIVQSRRVQPAQWQCNGRQCYPVSTYQQQQRVQGGGFRIFGDVDRSTTIVQPQPLQPRPAIEPLPPFDPRAIQPLPPQRVTTISPECQALIRAEIARQVAAIPRPKDGINGKDGKDGTSSTQNEIASIITQVLNDPANTERFRGQRGEPGRPGKAGSAGTVTVVIKDGTEEIARYSDVESGSTANVQIERYTRE